MVYEIIIVDDGSQNDTRGMVKKFEGSENVCVILQTKNLGKVAAVQTDIQTTTGDVLLIEDADLEYAPKEYPNLLEPIEQGKANVVYDLRF